MTAFDVFSETDGPMSSRFGADAHSLSQQATHTTDYLCTDMPLITVKRALIRDTDTTAQETVEE